MVWSRGNALDIFAHAAERRMIMAECIEKGAAIAAIISEPPDAHYPHWYADKIKSIPAADVATVRHGRWEHDHYENCCDNFEIVKCSRCGHQAYAIAFYVKSGNYCPNCGAMMDGD